MGRDCVSSQYIGDFRAVSAFLMRLQDIGCPLFPCFVFLLRGFVGFPAGLVPVVLFLWGLRRDGKELWNEGTKK